MIFFVKQIKCWNKKRNKLYNKIFLFKELVSIIFFLLTLTNKHYLLYYFLFLEFFFWFHTDHLTLPKLILLNNITSYPVSSVHCQIHLTAQVILCTVTTTANFDTLSVCVCDYLQLVFYSCGINVFWLVYC